LLLVVSGRAESWDPFWKRVRRREGMKSIMNIYTVSSFLADAADFRPNRSCNKGSASDSKVRSTSEFHCLPASIGESAIGVGHRDGDEEQEELTLPEGERFLREIISL
jgi:hypothetical protein